MVIGGLDCEDSFKYSGKEERECELDGSGVFCSFRKSKINDVFWMAGGRKQMVTQ